MKERNSFRRDLPAPPKQSYNNYASALAEALSILDTAYNVSPDEDGREFVEEHRAAIRQEMLDVIEPEENNE